MHNFKEFLDYCESFYSPNHPDPLYPIDGLTREELALATLNYLDLCESAGDGTILIGVVVIHLIEKELENLLSVGDQYHDQKIN